MGSPALKGQTGTRIKKSHGNLLRPVTTICILGDELRQNQILSNALESCPLNVVYFNEFPKDDASCDPISTIFVAHDFDKFDPVPETTFLGVTAFLDMAVKEKFYHVDRALYCHAMSGLGICFGRLKDRETLRNMFNLVRFMGGSVIKEIHSNRVTHVVADTCLEPNHKYASTFGIPIMTFDWLTVSWERRHEQQFRASESTFAAAYRIKPFQGLKMAFIGFPTEEKSHMGEELLRNGGKELPQEDKGLTHLVVDSSSVTVLPDELAAPHVVNGEWFWASIQMDACADETFYPFRGTNNRESKCFESLENDPTDRGCRRDRRKAVLLQLANNDEETQLLSETFQNLEEKSLSVSRMDSFFFNDLTFSNNHLLEDSLSKVSPSSLSKSFKSPKSFCKTLSTGWLKKTTTLTPRLQVFNELIQTESNYTSILRTILDIFKTPLEDPNMIGGQILNQTEIKLIFGNIPPIYEIHLKILNEFYNTVKAWGSQKSVGDVYLKHGDSILKAYLPYINFLESSKALLIEKDKVNPRFHAFLKRCQSNPDCGRQSLLELMIRPVQRLPSVQLLLTDLLKHCRKEKSRGDVVQIERGLEKIKEILTIINQNKRRTEAQVQLFSIFSEIENCPPYLVSSHRSFVRRIEVFELGGSDELCGRGSYLNLILFTDMMEVSKKRHSARGRVLRSPNAKTLPREKAQISLAAGNICTPTSSTKPFKHVKMIPLSSVKRVVDIVVSSDKSQKNVFGLVCRSNQEFKEKMYLFEISPRCGSKSEMLGQLCRLVANVMYRSDKDSYLRTMTTDDLGIDPAELTSENFGIRAYRSIHKRVNRALSFDRTPTSARIKRAFSAIVSPHQGAHEEGGFLTPVPVQGSLTERRKKLRLASCGDLLGRGESPLLRKSKSTFSVGDFVSESPSLLSVSFLEAKLTPGTRCREKPVRRPSLKMRAASLLRYSKKKSRANLTDT